MEIERKFLVNALPVLSSYHYKEITQAYIASDPVIRIRQMGNAYFLTVKSQGHIIREEFEMPITQTQYEGLWQKIEGTPIQKIRYFIPLEEGLTAELDLYKGHLTGLTTVEVEFSSLTASENFIPPTWFGLDISLDHRYKNNHLAQYGIPSHD